MRLFPIEHYYCDLFSVRIVCFESDTCTYKYDGVLLNIICYSSQHVIIFVCVIMFGVQAIKSITVYGFWSKVLNESIVFMVLKPLFYSLNY